MLLIMKCCNENINNVVDVMWPSIKKNQKQSHHVVNQLRHVTCDLDQIIFIKYSNYWGTFRDELHLSGYY